VYVFPAVLDADYVLLDLSAVPAPTSARDVYLRVQALLADGGWRVARLDDGLLLLEHGSAAPSPPRELISVERSRATGLPSPQLLNAQLVPSPDGAIDVDGPRWILRTTWQIDKPLSIGTRPDFWITLNDGQQLERWDMADAWWNPPDHWPLNQPVTVDVPDVPVRTFASWTVTWRTQ
jgi:hypothetical protein